MTGEEFTHPNVVLYCQLMENLKIRVDSVLQSLVRQRNKEHFLRPNQVAEFCLLELRFCIELLAIAIVAVHTDVSSRKVEDMWHAGQIMNKFKHLKPEFFPSPVQSQRTAEKHVTQVPVTGALTKEEVLKMYDFFGNNLHAGTFEKFKSGNFKRYRFELIEDFVSKLMKLLNEHTYFLFGEEKMVSVVMQNDTDGRVSATLLSKIGSVQ